MVLTLIMTEFEVFLVTLMLQILFLSLFHLLQVATNGCLKFLIFAAEMTPKPRICALLRPQILLPLVFDIELHSVQKLVYFLFGAQTRRQQVLAFFVPIRVPCALIHVFCSFTVTHEIIKPFSV